MKNNKMLQKIIGLIAGIFLFGCQGPGEPLKKDQEWNKKGEYQIPSIKVGQIVGIKAHEFGVREYLLSNGLKLIYRYYPQEKNKVYFSALTSGGPQSFEKQDVAILRSIISTVDASGVGPYSWSQIKQNNDLPPYLSTVFYDNRQGIEGEASGEDFAQLLQLFRLKLEANKISSEQWRFFPKNFPQTYQIEPDEWLFSGSKATSHLPANIRQHIDSSAQLTALYRQYIGQKNDFTFFIVGDIAPRKVEYLAGKYLATLLPAGENLTPIKMPKKNPRILPAKRMQKVARIDFYADQGRNMAEVRLYFTAPFLQANFAGDPLTLDALAHTLQIQLEALFKREGENATSLMAVFHQHPTNKLLEGRIFFECQRKDTDKLVKQAFAFLFHWPQNKADKALFKNIYYQHQHSQEENLQNPFLFKRYWEDRSQAPET